MAEWCEPRGRKAASGSSRGVPNTGVEYNWADGILYVAEDVPFHGNEVVFDCTLQRYLDVVLCSMDIHVHSIVYRCGMGEHMWQ